jgi:Amt family ammonium transporter
VVNKFKVTEYELMKKNFLLLATILPTFLASPAFAQSSNGRVSTFYHSSKNVMQVSEQTREQNGVCTGDTAWMLVSTALVMLMTPGLALFYGGMVRRKNVLGTIMQSFIALGIITVQWMLFGYSLAFGPDIWHVIGSLKWFALGGVGLAPDSDYAPTIPHQTYMIFQMMFAIITPALITGATAERFKFKTYIVFLLIWATFVYDPLAHWVWGAGGWIRNLGALDFAGGLVVHVSSGVSALAAAVILGKRRGYRQEPMPPHNMTMTLLGVALLWFGWFGFNAGSAVASGALATSAFVATHISASAASLSWTFAEWYTRGRPTVLGAASGAVAGLVAITPASGYVGPLAAFVIGTIGGIVCFMGIRLKEKFRYDDSLDTVGVHGVGGVWGALATGIFASKLINSNGANGLFYGNFSLLTVQLLAVAVAAFYAYSMTWLILKVLDKTMGLRVSRDEEIDGLDLSQHGESGYVFEEL